jgi:hypothetical protein
MDRVLTVLVLSVLIAPFVVLFVLVALAHLAPSSSMVARTSFVCPVRRRRVTVAFLTVPGFRRPADIAACSDFPDPEHVTCKKTCLDTASACWEPSPMTPRYSLIADGVSPRDTSK